jgi:cation:H+ antiporter
LSSSLDGSLRRRLAVTAACPLPGVLVRLSGADVPYPTQFALYGAAVIAAAFLLAWACETAQVDAPHGLVVAGAAFLATLPEFLIELHFAFTGQAEFVAANLTGASRLLIGCAIALPAAVALLRHRRFGPLSLPAPHRVELAVLLLAATWSLRAIVSGRLTLLDAVVLISLYGVYVRRAATSGGHAPVPTGTAEALSALPRRERRRWVAGTLAYAGVVLLLCAVPFGHSVLGIGAAVGISPFLLLQWIVPVATELPELVLACILLVHGRGGQSIAILLAGAVSQYTFALGTLPIAYEAGVATGPLPLAGRERVELLLTLGVALYGVGALIGLRLSRGDSAIMLALFLGQLLVPATVTRLLFALAFWAIALDLLAAERQQLPGLLRALRPAAAPAAGPARSRSGPARRRSRAAVAGTRSRRP